MVPLRNLVRISSLVEVKSVRLQRSSKELFFLTLSDSFFFLHPPSSSSSSCPASSPPGVAERALCGDEGDSEAAAVRVRVSREEGRSGSFTLPITGIKALQISFVCIIKLPQKGLLVCKMSV